jgi:hypothetical protein
MSQLGPRGAFEQKMAGPNAMAPPRSAPAPAPAPAPRAPRAPKGDSDSSPWGTPPSVGGFAVSGNGSSRRDTHPAQAYSGIGHPAGHRAYALAIAKHELAGSAGVREGSAMLRREIRRAANLTQPQKAKAMWRVRRANNRLAGALEAAARAAANLAKVRSEVNADIVSGKRKRRPGGFTVA